MKRSIEVTVSFLIIAFSALLIAGVVIHSIKTSIDTVDVIANETVEQSAVRSVDDYAELSSEENNDCFFSNVDDFIQYLNNNSLIDNTESNQNNDSYDESQIYHWAPRIVPSDADLVNIMNNNHYTVFNYYLTREYTPQPLDLPKSELDNTIDMMDYDDLLDGLCHALITTTCSQNFNNVTDYEEYAANLAARLGCENVDAQTNITIYSGDVYARVYNTTINAVLTYLAGTQTVVCSHEPGHNVQIIYTYTPASLSEVEAAEFHTEMQNYISGYTLNE